MKEFISFVFSTPAEIALETLKPQARVATSARLLAWALVVLAYLPLFVVVFVLSAVFGALGLLREWWDSRESKRRAP